MVSLYKDPKGEDIFKLTGTINKSALSMGSGHKKDSNLTDMTLPGLKKRIKDLEDEMKQKDVCSYDCV